MLSNIKKKFSAYTWDIAYGKYDEHIISEGLNWDELHIVKYPYKPNGLRTHSYCLKMKKTFNSW